MVCCPCCASLSSSHRQRGGWNRLATLRAPRCRLSLLASGVACSGATSTWRGCVGTWSRLFDFRRLGDAPWTALYAQARATVDHQLWDTPAHERQEMAMALARYARAEVDRRQWAERISLSLADRRSLIVAAGSPPRCWVCGSTFPEEALDRFLKVGSGRHPGASALRRTSTSRAGASRGIYSSRWTTSCPSPKADSTRRICASPVAGANRVKSNSLTLYAAPAGVRYAKHPSLGKGRGPPSPFWVVRLLGLRGRCEAPEGCDQTTSNARLTVCMRNVEGAPNPLNLMVCCYEHDSLKDRRFVPERVVGLRVTRRR